MTEIEQKALALVNEVLRDSELPREPTPITREYWKALCRAIEQHEAFKRVVSDAVEELRDTCYVVKPWRDRLDQFIIPAPKPDPLVDAMDKLEWCNTDALAKYLRDTLDALGFEIREKG